ncbi:hypothetical protein ACT0MQ_004526, partial [Shigella flexneri]|uniref:hypothetical protein n=1 Tax=Shigella sp. FC3196 TaxID=1898678 RepID=UPI001BDB9761
EQVPASTLQTVPAKVPDLTPISGYQRPTRPGDITPRIMDDWGSNHAGSGWLTPHYKGYE